MQKLGRHLIVEFCGCDSVYLDDIHYVRKHMLIAAEKAGATVVGEKFHQFSPQGVSGAAILAESHLSIHTWPESNYAAIDFFTCGDHCDPTRGIDYLKSVFDVQQENRRELDRGIPDI
jgi:S-adenosylmethionine decarboxylase proenzyme